MERGLGITNNSRDTALSVLEQVLCDENVLYMKLRNYHWNVEGERHRDLRSLFADQYRIIERHIDEVAERVRTLEAKATGTMTEYLQRSQLREHPGRHFAAKDMLNDVLESHYQVIRFVRASLLSPRDPGIDVGSADLLTRLLQDHEKITWMLRATFSGDLAGSRLRREERTSVLYD